MCSWTVQLAPALMLGYQARGGRSAKILVLGPNFPEKLVRADQIALKKKVHHRKNWSGFYEGSCAVVYDSWRYIGTTFIVAKKPLYCERDYVAEKVFFPSIYLRLSPSHPLVSRFFILIGWPRPACNTLSVFVL